MFFNFISLYDQYPPYLFDEIMEKCCLNVWMDMGNSENCCGRRLPKDVSGYIVLSLFGLEMELK